VRGGLGEAFVCPEASRTDHPFRKLQGSFLVILYGGGQTKVALGGQFFQNFFEV
jgi:hypothetical protein